MGYYNNISSPFGAEVAEDTVMEGRYIIWEPMNRHLTPSRTFTDRPTAIKAAYAMAGKNPGKRFVVLKAVGEARTQDVKFNSFEE